MNKKNTLIFFIYSFSCCAMENETIAQAIQRLHTQIAAQTTPAPFNWPDETTSLQSIIKELREQLAKKNALLEAADSVMQTFKENLQQKEQENTELKGQLEKVSSQLIEMHDELSTIKQENQKYQTYVDSMRQLTRKKREEWEARKASMNQN